MEKNKTMEEEFKTLQQEVNNLRFINLENLNHISNLQDKVVSLATIVEDQVVTVKKILKILIKEEQEKEE